MTKWIPMHDPDHIVELDANGEPLRVIKGSKTIKEITKNNFDGEKLEGRIDQVTYNSYKARYKF